jgi:hypothetical protein
MTIQTTRQSTIRAFIVAIGLLLASILSTGPASASTLIAMVDMGGPGGGGGTASTIAPHVLTANERSIQLTESREPAPVEVASQAPYQSSPSQSAF